MKKVFRTHWLLVFEGRLFLLLVGIASPIMCYVYFRYLIEDFVSDRNYMMLLFGTPMYLAFWPLSIYVLQYFWELIWGKLILTDEYVLWRCIFCKPVKIPYEDIKYVKITPFKEGNVRYNRDYYKTGFLYVLLASTPFPQKRIDKIRCKKGLIKFPLYNNKIGTELYLRLPDPYNRYFSQYKPPKKKIKKEKSGAREHR